MARISPLNPRYRTKQEIAKDIAKVLKSNLHHGTKFAVVKEVTWVWTEYHGKFKGCMYWSEKALRRYRKERSSKNLRHEHVVPRTLVMARLFALKHATPSKVRRILDKLLIGAVITKREDALLSVRFHKSMPDGFSDRNSPSFRDPWLRYRECGIRIRMMAHQTSAILKPLAKVVQGAVSSDRDLQRLAKALGRNGWIDSNFDWIKWKSGERYLRDPELLATADITTIRKLFTMHFRKERVCDGHLNDMVSNGHFKHLLRRLRTLRVCRAFE